MAKQTITVPDIGGSDNVDVIEVCVNVGDSVEKEDSLLVLESDKASMEVPAPTGGKVLSISVKEGDKVSEGDAVMVFELESDSSTKEKEDAPSASPAENVEAPTTAESKESTFSVPDIGGSDNVDVIELCVEVGEEVSEGDSLIVLESDKASMEVPSPASGKLVKFLIKEGDKVSEGDQFVVIATGAGDAPVASTSTSTSTPAPTEKAKNAEPKGEQQVNVPDIGGSESVDVIEVSVAVGDEVSEGDAIVVLESDKASMEVPSPYSGKIKSLIVQEGAKVSEGSALLVMEVEGVPADAPAVSSPGKPNTNPTPEAPPAKKEVAIADDEYVAQSDDVYAGPAVRKLARQLGVKLSDVKPSGPRNRHTKDDVKGFVKKVMTQHSASGSSVTGGAGIPAIPAIDFAKFGEIELVKMSKIKKLTAENMSRNWLNVPHVTQFDDVDITELEAFRKSMKAEAEKSGVKLTPLPFLIKAAAAALAAEPSFNVSMHHDGQHIVQKKYINIGVAVDTPNGLMVPVIKDVDKKGLYEISKEVIALAGKARDGKLMPKEMQGGCFTISSLGPIGGTGFTPIVNAPEVAILGVSKADIKPRWNGSEFEPRQMLPLALSYDHRAINGGDAGRFFTFLNSVLADVRRLIL